MCGLRWTGLGNKRRYVSVRFELVQGLYRCTVSNTAGTASRTFYVDIVDPPVFTYQFDDAQSRSRRNDLV